MVKKLGLEHVPLQEKLVAILDQASAVDQQIAIELLTTRHAVKMGGHDKAMFVADGMAKHVRQLVQQWFDNK